MFDLSRVGKQIKKYRINADMTQMELAERMGVSFQAVSSWERSETMPDISRLVELGEIFRVSVDEILDHQEKTSTVIRLMSPRDEEISIKELEDLEGIIKPSDISKYKLKIESIEDIEYIIAFVGRDMAAELVESHKELINSIDDIIAVAPFISRETVDKIVLSSGLHAGCLQDICTLLPFISNDTIKEILGG